MIVPVAPDHLLILHFLLIQNIFSHCLRACLHVKRVSLGGRGTLPCRVNDNGVLHKKFSLGGGALPPRVNSKQLRPATQTKMAGRRNITVVNAIVISLSSPAAALQLSGLSLTYLLLTTPASRVFVHRFAIFLP